MTSALDNHTDPFCEQALALAKRGFHVFPVKAGAKMPPLIQDFPTHATMNPNVILGWWRGNYQGANIGISTSTFGDGEALLVVDIDNKGSKNGDASVLDLELRGCPFPATYVQLTPTGGRHFVYRVPVAVRQSVGKIASGLDVRSRGGYVVGAGSRLPAGLYRDDGGLVGAAPGWLIERCSADTKADRRTSAAVSAVAVDPAAAIDRARAYLDSEAPLAVEGNGGNATTFAVSCRLRDFGVTESICQHLMDGHWNLRCSPPWTLDELFDIIHNAYEYAADVPGNSAPETVFKPVAAFTDREQSDLPEQPFATLNRNYAFVIAGGGHHILWETVDAKGRAELLHLSIAAFHAKHAAWKMKAGKLTVPVTLEWMESKERRGYDGICFAPERESPVNFYNLWRGFAVKPAATSDHPAVTQWLEHCKLNVCQGDEKLYAWLIGYFAHMIQKPWEKPLVALVFRGGKGVGKNALVGAIGSLLGGHYLLSSNRRYLVGNFNGHLENLLLFVLDEAFWSGDKQAEGTLKDLITGGAHVIEHKGKEPYAVDNLTRVAIIGNENWLVPASHDERRFAVFNVGDGRKQDRDFFSGIARGMESGGAACLLRYLLTYDLSQVDINAPPASAGLLDQKHESLVPLAKYWLMCLQDGMLHASEFGTEWPVDKIEVERFATAYRRWLRDNNMSIRPPTRMFHELHVFAPSITRSKMRVGTSTPYGYQFPPLAQARLEWEQHIGQPVKWEH